VTPGHWMAGCAKDSVLFRDAPITVIPNPIEMDHLWHPVPKDFARSVLGLSQDKNISCLVLQEVWLTLKVRIYSSKRWQM